jgi:rod shape-determining protein MreC
VSRHKVKTLVYLGILAGVFLLVFSRSRVFVPLKFSVIESTSLPIRILTFPFFELKKILYYHYTYDRYLQLQKENNGLKARLSGLDEVIRENNRFEKLLNFKRQLIFSSVTANVIGRDPSDWNATMIIDRGTRDGIDLGMPVVSAQGVVGKIAEVSEGKAKIMLLTDPSFSVTALVQRSRETGLVSGTLQGFCRMRYLASGADIQVGDQVITSKLSSSFPEGLLVGEVAEVTVRDNGLTVDCIVKPAVLSSQIEEVLVIQHL